MRVNSRIVVVDISVTDRKGHPVPNLGQDDFVVRENGVLQSVRNFEEHTIPLQPARLSVADRPNHFVTPEIREKEPTATAILLDMLNTPQQDQFMMRESILRFLKHQPANAQIAIFGLTDHLLMLQPFTTEAGLLRRVVEEKVGSGKQSMQNRTIDPTQASVADAFSDFSKTDDPTEAARLGQLAANLSQYEAAIQNEQQKTSNLVTFHALAQLATFLGSQPGKKNLIWFSDGIPILTTPDSTLDQPTDTFNDSREGFANLIALMNKNRIAVYPVDPRGVAVPPAYTAASGIRDPSQREHSDRRTAERAVSQIQAAGLLAQKTGGKAFFFRNNLDRAVEEVVDLGSKYYSISYSPNNQQWDGTFRKLNISLKQKGYRVAYREGYYATDRPQSGGGSKTRIESVLKGAMLFGAPARGDLPFTVDIGLVAETETSPAPRTEFAPSVEGPYRRYRLDYSIDAHNLSFAERHPGVHEASVKFFLLLYNLKGNIIASTNNELAGKLSTDSYQRLLTKGVHLQQEISAPQSGTFIARIAAEDLATGKVGVIEVPLTADMAQAKGVVPAEKGGNIAVP